MKAKDEQKLPDISVKAVTLASILGISERRVYQLAEGKVLPREAPGQYPLFGSIRGYIRYLRRLMKWHQGHLHALFTKINVRTYYEKMASYEDINAQSPELQPFTLEELQAMFPKKGGQ